MLPNLFCQTAGCDNLAFWGDVRIGFWCRRHYQELDALLEQKLISGEPFTPLQRQVYQVMHERLHAQTERAAD